MKKLLSIFLSVLMICSVVSLAGCGSNKALKFGVGIYAYYEKAAEFEEEQNREAKTVVNVAAVLVDNDGKIIDCEIDTAENTQSFTAKGEYITAGEMKTKYELGDSYGMVAYAGSQKEWYEQADAFCALVKGKTLTDVKALVATDGKGNDQVINAGCTISVSDFVKAIEIAVNNAKDSAAKEGNTLKIGMVSAQTDVKNATEEAGGVNEIDTSIVATALDKNGKVVAAYSDVVASKSEFDIKGSDLGTDTELASKRSAGDSYGMAAYGTDLNGDGKVLEWYEQAQVLDNALIGKTFDEISALVTSVGYAVDDIQASGCTIEVSDIIKAAVKAAQ